jgi:hypothetical protein
MHLHGSSPVALAVSSVVIAVTALIPDVTTFPNDAMATWLFRGVLIVSLALNLHFLRKVYLKVSSIDRMRQQIRTITKTLRFLSGEASGHDEHIRKSDSLIQDLLSDLDENRELE